MNGWNRWANHLGLDDTWVKRVGDLELVVYGGGWWEVYDVSGLVENGSVPLKDDWADDMESACLAAETWVASRA